MVRAPGKLLLMGAYAVLEGAPALVIAVDRYALAREAAGPPVETPHEVRLAFAAGRAPAVDTTALRAGEQKLGLGSSAAGLVAALGLEVVRQGGNLAAAATRRALFDRARHIHALAQSGGSGVDVAAAVYGGALAYTLSASDARVTPIELPPGLRWTAYWSGRSARTSELLERVRGLRSSAPALWASRQASLRDASLAGERAISTGDLHLLLAAIRAQLEGLQRLGHDCGAPIVPPAFAALAERAAAEGGVFLPSGAGGGDVGLFLGGAVSPAFDRAARALEMQPLALALDRSGVCAL
jgi:phosphomevalonate kinase